MLGGFLPIIVGEDALAERRDAGCVPSVTSADPQGGFGACRGRCHLRAFFFPTAPPSSICVVDAKDINSPVSSLPTPETHSAMTTESTHLGGHGRSRAVKQWFQQYDPRAWYLTFIVTVVAALTRLPLLGAIKRLVFDETYYVKDAYSLKTIGYEGTWKVPPAWPAVGTGENAARDAINAAFARGDFSALTADPSYVVHPQTGKWLIALGMDIFGMNSWGWRIAAALAGILTVTLLCRLAWHLFGAHLPVALAGLALSFDGVSIVLSRIGLLDVFLALFTVAATLCVVLDRRTYRPRLLARLANAEASGAGLGPHAGSRPWLLLAGVFCGLASSVKWSGLYVLAAIGIFVVIDEVVVRRGRLRHWLLAGVVVEGIPAFFYLVPVAAFVYVASWWSWFVHPHSWGRNGDTGIQATLNQWIDYHLQMYQFHSSLSSPHSYMSSAYQWLFQWRPTSVAFETQSQGCSSHDCVRALLALGNPALWWLALAGMVFAVVLLFRRGLVAAERYPLAVIALGYTGTFLPWFAYLNRTTFNFYTVVISPFVALLFTWSVMVLVRLAGESSSLTRRRVLLTVVVASLVLVMVCFVFFFPIWSGMLVDRSHWQWRMWLPSWV